MEFTGKRTDRIRLPKQLGLQTDLGRYIRLRAELHDRDIEQQILHYIKEGIRAEKNGNGEQRT